MANRQMMARESRFRLRSVFGWHLEPVVVMIPLAMIFGASFLSGCVDGPCRALKHPQITTESRSPASLAQVPLPSDDRVLVSRPDGSLQCGIKAGISLEEMEKDLKGIKVYSRTQQPDGKMHIQVCGGSTGILNVYEIPSSSLKDAENRGFKKIK